MMEALHAYVRRPLGGGFARGERDCCAWVDGWVAELTGTAVAADLLGPMSRREAVRRLRAGGGLRAITGERLEAAGWRAVSGLPARPGDVIVFPDETALGGEGIGIVLYSDRLLTLGEDGGAHVRPVCYAPPPGLWRWPGKPAS